jgi:hypothetical protein
MKECRQVDKTFSRFFLKSNEEERVLEYKWREKNGGIKKNRIATKEAKSKKCQIFVFDQRSLWSLQIQIKMSFFAESSFIYLNFYEIQFVQKIVLAIFQIKAKAYKS